MSDLLNSASLVLIPSGYKEDVLYSQVPTDGSADMAFTRASNGTRINSAGLVEVCPWNFMQYSEDFGNGVWSTTGITITTNTTTAPNGTTTADTADITVNGGHYLLQSFGCVPNQQYTFSFYVKRGTATDLYYSVFDNTNGSNIIAPSSYYSQTSSTNWSRISVSFTTPNNCTAISVYPLRDTPVIGTAYLWGAQLNIGSTAKPYFPTTDRLNVPRLTYQNGGGGCPSLLLEKQSTNLALQSNALATSPWQDFGGIQVNNSTTSPDGTQNASKLQYDGSIVGAYQTIVVTAGSTYTASMYAKLDDATNICLVINNTAAWNTVGGISFTTSNGLIANQWARVQFTFTAPATGQINMHIGQHSETGITTQSIGSFFIWGCQVELGSYSTSLIYTTSSSATRVADACGKTGISSLLSSSEYTLFWQGSHIATGEYNSFMTASQTINSSNSARFYRNNTNNEIRAAIFNASNGLTLDLGSNVTTTRVKCALRVKNGDFALFINGVKTNSNTTALAPSSVLDEINLQYFNNSQSFGQNCEMACFFKTALTDTEAIALTTL